MLPSTAGEESDSWEGPIKKMVSPLTKKIIIANKDLIEDISTGAVDSCDVYYPVQCNGTESHSNCVEGLIGCDKKTGNCPAFFQEGASKQDDMVSGWVCLVMSLFLLILCLIGLVTLLRRMLYGASTRIIYKATSINGYVAMVVGCGVTILVQSSSITTSTLVPLAGIGVLKLEQVYPLTLGADIGTTFTALMAAMVSSKIESLQIALAHLFFNLTGIILWYPIPFLRKIPMDIARKLGKATRQWRTFPLLFILVMFFLAPLLLLGISSCFEKGTKGFTALGVFLILLIGGGLAYFWLWWSFRGGKQSCHLCIRRRQRRAAALEHLAEDLDYLKCDIEYTKNEIGRLKDYAGVPQIIQPVLPRQESDQLPSAEDDAISLFQSCQSKPWQDVLLSATQSVRESLHGGSVGWSLGSSTRSRARNGGGSIGWSLGSSTRSRARNGGSSAWAHGNIPDTSTLPTTP
jgi:sodium-dependent phosphate cotransporter